MLKNVFIAAISLVFLGINAGCAVQKTSLNVSMIVFTVDSGPVLPEMQTHEVFTITRQGVQLERTGKTENTEIHEGNWTFEADETLLSAVFAAAESQNCEAFTRVEPEEPPDGAGTTTLTLVYSDGTQCELFYDAGVNYEGAEELLLNVKELLNNLSTPPSSQIK